ncbi:ATP-binding cassette domain-containing protein [Paramicrobacterium humi]|nr:ATP-binding cassette domain-containing protein [Microbacterium humi]
MGALTVQSARSAQAVLRVRDLSVNYGPLTALQGVDLNVYAGETVGIAGDNGAGKTTLLRCVLGDLDEARGEVWLDGERLTPRSAAPAGRIGVVWQHLVLSDNLDVAANLTLGKERRRMLTSQSKLHEHAQATLDELGIPIRDTSRPVWTLTAAERQLLAVARAVSPAPQLLLLDEPTAVLNRTDAVRVEELIRRFHDAGTTSLLVSHDVDQLFRLADRIVVLRHGHAVAQLDPARSHPDELLALMAGHDASSAPRRQLSRLQGLADQLTSAGPAAGLTLILSTLGAALGSRQLSLHVLEQSTLTCIGSVGLPRVLSEAWQSISLYAGSGPIPAAAVRGEVVVADLAGSDELAAYDSLFAKAGIASWWAVPFSSGSDLRGVISIYRAESGAPRADEMDLINLYAGYAAAALERDRLLAELTTRNKVLETIRSVLQTLAGQDSLDHGISTALRTLRSAIGADEIGLYESVAGSHLSCRAFAGAPDATPSARLAGAVEQSLSGLDDDGRASLRTVAGRGSRLFVRVSTTTVLAAEWTLRLAGDEERVLLEDAGHSIMLAEERARAELARHEMTALRRSQELQRQFLARLSHELRTPLTAIRGYASSLMQPDVTWDEESEHRFLSRISTESARLRTLVDDLLDFSMIESGMLRLRSDWVDLPLVVDAARSCLSAPAAAAVEVRCEDGVPVVWADHDRLEQVMVNLMDNAVRHNPPGTRVWVEIRSDGANDVVISVTDDGTGIQQGAGRRAGEGRPASTAGAGLGLSITRGIVEAHNGTLHEEAMRPGTRFLVRLPIEATARNAEADDA